MHEIQYSAESVVGNELKNDTWSVSSVSMVCYHKARLYKGLKGINTLDTLHIYKEIHICNTVYRGIAHSIRKVFWFF